MYKLTHPATVSVSSVLPEPLVSRRTQLFLTTAPPLNGYTPTLPTSVATPHVLSSLDKVQVPHLSTTGLMLGKMTLSLLD
jgi:hypothetical protein